MGPAPRTSGSAAFSDAEAFVLAGGGSTRMGQDKALLRLAGRPLIEIALDKLRAVGLASSAVRIAGARSDLSSYAPVVADLHSGCGPLSGIEAALSATTQPFNLFLPVDLPLVPAPFLAWMLMRAQITGALVTIPRVNGLPQPLCGVYHRDLLANVTAALVAGNYKVMPAVATAAESHPQAVDIFDVELLASTNTELRRVTPLPVHRWFHNCNTPADMIELLTLENRRSLDAF
jgi:molybdopterin-guanine dinucleotide biosynthesis protein A